ncbi:MAG TPA: hypothetical protein VLS89_07455 [Candidatus Nanopelagicales bacterium]|nr:hypothetical protein [Candidatus Nanopelagicales bacterium]
MNPYDPINDLSREGRRRLVEERGDEIRLLLDEAFTAFLDAEPGVNLSAFGFRGDDPVAEAVAWSIERFASGDLDPGRLSPASRSFRLFTEVRFWLSQKAGRAGYDRIIAASRGPLSASPSEEPSAGGADTDSAVFAFGKELAGMLPSFRDRTCADMVGYWLEGTRRLRRDWFGWGERGDLPEAAARRSKKQRSIHTHDAMFRFLCCFLDLVPARPDAAAELALELTCLSGCPNEPPYRVPNGDVCARLAHLGVRGPREVGALRKQGAGAFLQRLLDQLDKAITVARDRLQAELIRRSLSKTTLHALELEDNTELRERLEQTPAGVDEEESR